MIARGRIAIFLRQDDGADDAVVAVRGPGEIFGEMALIDSNLRSASARAIEDCVLVPVSEAQIQHCLSETDPILRLCLGVVIARYREAVALLKEHGLRPNASPARHADPSPGARADFDAALAAVVVERELRRALDRGEFELFFQPIVHLGRETLAGFEALIRWRQARPRGPGPVHTGGRGERPDRRDHRLGLSEVGRVVPKIMLACLQNIPAAEGPLFVSVNISGHDLASAYLSGDDRRDAAPGRHRAGAHQARDHRERPDA